MLVPAVLLIVISSMLLGLFIAVSVGEVFEAQIVSNVFRFPRLFLCGSSFSLQLLPVCLQPVSHVLPLTYGADILYASIHRSSHLSLELDFGLRATFCLMLFAVNL